MSDADQNTEILELTTEILSAYVSNNSVSQDELSSLIETVSAMLDTLNGTTNKLTAKLEPVVSVKKSRTDSHIICLHCGKQFKSIKRHISASHNQTPEEYRAAFGLPFDYAMVTTKYAEKRSEIAKDFKLGRKPGKLKK